jgi:hypothetical protein
MNIETIDWECWEVERPSPVFADRVMAAAMAGAHRSAPAPRRRRSLRWIGILAAAAVAAGSLTVLAMRGGSYRAAAPAPSSHVPPVARAETRYAAGTVVDRKLRDTLYARLVVPLQSEGVERDPHTGLTIPAGASGPSHNLSREYLQARIREDFYPLALACYESALAAQPKLAGKIVVDFMIVGDAKVGGIVDQAKINDRTDIDDAKMTGCIRESMLSMVFAPPENDGWVSVTYPFEFAPEGDAGP